MATVRPDAKLVLQEFGLGRAWTSRFVFRVECDTMAREAQHLGAEAILAD